ncbi:DUF2649 family protein [Spiroplasma endosymbiont of Phyllotreta cruciferae]|uniref:DUF2649 family protein n=1 Tax=Spiroplasma endosymbiont of Phyllotreta cruciferae TaxID=2886375 RepID=UPI00209E0378|nr:DUF2649 family protein [Spiroplasma endosymbiont of Phyllotreta cruciferae]
MQNDWEKLKEFFTHVFLFIDKSNVESITTWNLTQNEYLTLMIGVWIVILFLIMLFIIFIKPQLFSYYQELSSIAYKAGCIDNINKLVKALWTREHETSTWLEDGFAVPHARMKDIKKPAVIFVCYQTGLSWPTFDNSPVQVAIALIIPTNKKNDIHLEVLSNVAKKLLNADLRQTLKTESDKKKL